MEQKVSHKGVNIDGVISETLVLSIRDVKYPMSGTVVEMTIKDAAELSRLLLEKLDGIPL